MKIPIQNISNLGNTIYLFCREPDGTLKIIEDKKFLPYYYEKTTDRQADSTSIYGEPLIKIYCNKPGDVRKQRNLNSYEADISYTKLYILDKIETFQKSIPRIVFFDIEVRCTDLPHPKEDQVAESEISVITIFDNYDKKYNTFFIQDYESELKMLEDFCNTIKEIKPDILTAFNVDFDYYYLFYRIGEDFPKKISPVSQVQWERGFQYPAGISIVDFQGLYAKYTLHKKDSYALMRVANDELNYDIEEEFDFTDVDVARTKNVLDVKKMVELNDKLNLFEYFDEIRIISRCLWVDLPSEMKNYQWQSNNSKVIDMLALAEARRLKVVLPSKGIDCEKGNVDGAYRRVESTGLFKNLSKVDVSGDYPAQIIGFCLSPENLSKVPVENSIKVQIVSRENREQGDIYYFIQNQDAIIPVLTKKVLDLKNELKEKLKNTAKDDPSYKQIELAYDSRKALANSCFGVIGMPFFRLYSSDVTNTITFLARELLQTIENKATRGGHIVRYLDTDSFFIDGKENITEKLNDWAIEWAMDNYNNDKVDIKFEWEGYFSSIFIQAMCRYRGRLETLKGQKIETKGIQAKRKDVGEWVKDFQENLYDKILDDCSKEQILTWINEKIEDMMHCDDICKIALPVKINKKLEDYKTTPKWEEPLKETQKIIPQFNQSIGNRFYIIYCKSVDKLALSNKYCDHIKRDDIDWQKMLERNIFNLLVPIFKGLQWEEDLLNMAEYHGTILKSQYRNNLLENNKNFEQLKIFYSAKETKKRIESKKNTNQESAEKVSEEIHSISNRKGEVQALDSALKTENETLDKFHQIQEKKKTIEIIDDFNFSSLIIKELDFKVTKEFIIANHYSHTLGSGTQANIGFFYKDELVTATVYGHPIGINVGKWLKVPEGSYAELVRVFSKDSLPRNTESYCLGQSFKWLKEKKPNIKYLISYADATHGHVGYIYQATNWFYVGTQGSKDRIFLIDDKPVHRRTANSIYGTSSVQKLTEILGNRLKVTITHPKHIYLMCLGNKKERRDFYKNFDQKIYPKIDSNLDI